jgi:hypothetical protein
MTNEISEINNQTVSNAEPNDKVGKLSVAEIKAELKAIREADPEALGCAIYSIIDNN